MKDKFWVYIVRVDQESGCTETVQMRISDEEVKSLIKSRKKGEIFEIIRICNSQSPILVNDVISWQDVYEEDTNWWL